MDGAIHGQDPAWSRPCARARRYGDLGGGAGPGSVLSNGVLQSGGYTVLIDPGSTISATTPAGTAGTPARAV
jgi:hypothetical protein